MRHHSNGLKETNRMENKLLALPPHNSLADCLLATSVFKTDWWNKKVAEMEHNANCVSDKIRIRLMDIEDELWKYVG